MPRILCLATMLAACGGRPNIEHDIGHKHNEVVHGDLGQIEAHRVSGCSHCATSRASGSRPSSPNAPAWFPSGWRSIPMQHKPGRSDSGEQNAFCGGRSPSSVPTHGPSEIPISEECSSQDQ
eukprot:10501941-Alexandrium_andersonii.AAC.1